MKNPPFLGTSWFFSFWHCQSKLTLLPNHRSAPCLENMIPPKFQIIKNFEVGIQVQDFFLILSLPTCWSVCGSDLLRSNKVELKIVLLAFLWAIASKQLGHYSKIGGVNEKKKKMRSIISATNLVETLTLRRRRRGQHRASSRLRMEIQTGLSFTHLFSFAVFENFTLWKTINRVTGIGISNISSLN